ncbi:MAG: helix-turn-helix transcriptional regulator [Phycisphaeraceae bacterium]
MTIAPGPGGHVRCEPGWRLDQRWSDRLADYDLWLVWAGRGAMQMRHGTVNLRPGVMLWMRPGGLYLGAQDERDRLGVTYLHFDLLHTRSQRRPPESQLPPEVCEVLDPQAYQAIMRRTTYLREQARRHPQAAPALSQAAAALLRGLLIDLSLSPIIAPPTRDPTQHLHRRIILELAGDLATSPKEAPSIAALALRAGYSAAHFSRIFRQVMGVGPQRFIVECRIRRASQLLRETDWSITHIARSMGYSDVFFFSRQFKQITGHPPTQHRGGDAP